MHRLKAIATATVIVAGAGWAAVSEAQAQGRPSTLGMTCGQAQSLVRNTGAIVLSTGQYTYDRFVASSNFCNFDEEPIPTWAPTRDTRQCMVGYRCERRRPFFDR